MSQSESSREGSPSSLSSEKKSKNKSGRRVFSTGSIFDKILKKSNNKQSKKSSTAPDLVMDDPPLTPISFHGYKSTTRHRLLTEELADEIRNLMPPRVQLYSEWELIYSLEQHGISLNTLYHNCNPETQLSNKRKQKAEKGFGESTIQSMINESKATQSLSANTHKREGYILIIKDEGGNIFGGYSNEYFRPSEHRRYYGNGECFLWKSEKVLSHVKTSSSVALEEKADDTDNFQREQEHTIRFKAFPYTGLNDYIVYSNHKYLAIGVSGGKFGVCVDNDLNEGISSPCDTFGNETLSGKEKFKIMGLEVWKVC